MARNVILLEGSADEENAIASEALTPGELILYAATEGQVKASDAANDADALKAWVRENSENEGDGVSTDIASGDSCTVIFPETNAKVNARIAHGTDVQQGAALGTDGNGALQVYSSGRIVAFADEDIANTSGSAGLYPVRVA